MPSMIYNVLNAKSSILKDITDKYLKVTDKYMKENVVSSDLVLDFNRIIPVGNNASNEEKANAWGTSDLGSNTRVGGYYCAKYIVDTSYDTMTFETPLTHPREIVRKLAEIYKDKFMLYYTDPDAGFKGECSAYWDEIHNSVEMFDDKWEMTYENYKEIYDDRFYRLQ